MCIEISKMAKCKFTISQDAFNVSLQLVVKDEFPGGMKIITACLVESYSSKETLYTAKVVHRLMQKLYQQIIFSRG